MRINKIFNIAKSRVQRVSSFSKKSKVTRKVPFKKLAVLIVIIALAAVLYFLFKDTPRQVAGTQSKDEVTFVAEGSTLNLNKKFNIAIKDSSGKEVGSDLVVNTSTLVRTDEIIYRGRSLVARPGKDFLVVNLEVENSTDNRLNVRPVDFFRIADSSGKTYAPDIQTDIVKVEPFSTKKTRTIFIISEQDKILKLTIGEIKGDNKETVEVKI